MAKKSEKLKAPVVGIPVTPPYEEKPQQTYEPVEVTSANDYTQPGNAFNQPHFSMKYTDKATPDYGLGFTSRGEVEFNRKDKVSYPKVVDLLNKAGAKITPKDVNKLTADDWTPIRDEYNRLHKEGKIIPTLQSEGLLEKNQIEPAKVAEKAQEEGKSFVQMYMDAIKKPEYDEKQAKKLKTNGNLSLLADIVRLVGEGVTTSHRGTPIARQSVVPHLNDKLQRLNDLYNSKVEAYNSGKFNYLLADEKDKRSRAASALEMARKQAWHDDDMSFKKGKMNQDAVLAQKKLEQDDRQHKETIGVQREHNHIVASKKDSKDDEKYRYFVIDGKSTRVPLAYVTDVAGKVKKGAKAADTTLAMSPEEVFSSNWQDHYTYKNGEFVPKQKAASPQEKKVATTTNNYLPGGSNSPVKTKKTKDPLGLGI